MSMKNITKIREIVDENMRDAFPIWDDISDSDPLKIFSEAIVSSLIEIDKSQEKNISKMIDSVPGLLGFYPKTPSLARGLFFFNVRKRNEVKLKIPNGLSLKYSSDDANGQIIFEEQEIFPLEIKNQNSLEDSFELEISLNSLIDNFKIYFIPNKKAAPSALNEIKLKYFSEDGSEKFLFDSEILLKDDTAGLTQPGTIEINIPKIIFDGKKFKEINVYLKKGLSSQEGKFYVNLLKGSICNIVKNFEIGKIEGRVWEEVFLDQNVLMPPSKLRLEFLNGDVKDLLLIKEDILKIRNVSSDKFENSYFYNGLNHSLIFPGAEDLLSGKIGGALLKAKDLICTIPDYLFPDLKSKISIDGVEESVSSISPVAKISSSLLRESKNDFLNRFYKTLKQFYQFNSSLGQIPSFDYLKTSILNLDNKIRSVEIFMNESEKRLNVYLLTFNPFKDLNDDLDRKLIEKVRDSIDKIVPVDSAIYISGFNCREFSVDLILKVKVTSNNISVVNSDSLKNIIENECYNFFYPDPFGLMKQSVSYSKDEFKDYIKEKLASIKNDIESLEVSFLDNALLSHVNEISRKSGQIIRPNLNVNIELNDLEFEEEDIMLDSNSVKVFDMSEEFYNVFS